MTVNSPHSTRFSQFMAERIVGEMVKSESTVGVWSRQDVLDLIERKLRETLPDVCIELLIRAGESSKKQMQYMTEPELREHLNNQLRFIKASQTSDTIGSMLIIFQRDGISQYGATVDPETAPQALRELADRIEKRQTVKR